MRTVFSLVVLVFLVAGKGILDGKSRKTSQSPEYPQCSVGSIDVHEGVGAHSCVVYNRGQEWQLVRVMCGGGDKPDKDVDRATYVYTQPQSQTLVLKGMCPVGHRCRVCGATPRARQAGDDINGQPVLEQQDYECRRRCIAVLYQHEDFNGHIQTFSHNANNLKNTLMEGKISAVKVIGKDCQLRLFDNPNLEDELRPQTCRINTGENQEVTRDMDEIKDKCGCHDCVESMSIRETIQCGTQSSTSNGENVDCIPCKNGVVNLGCCITDRKAHGSGVTDRAEALKRLFKAMANVLQE